MSLARRMFFASVVLALIVAAAFAALIFAVSAQRDAVARETRSREVTAAALRLEKLVVEVETGVRGYAITRDEFYLDPYTTANREIGPAIRALRSLVGDDEAQRNRAGIIGQRAREYREWGQTLVNLVRDEPDVGNADLVVQTGAIYTEEIRQRVTDFLEEENKLAMAAAEDADRTARLAVIVGAIGIGASTALIVLFGVYLARAVGRPVRSVADGASRLAAGELHIAPAGGRPGRDRRAHPLVQRDGRAARAEQRGAPAAERGAARERADEDRAREHRLARAAHAACERARLHGASAEARVRPCRPAPLSRDHRRAGAPSRGAARGLPRRAADRASGARALGGKRRPRLAARRAGPALRRAEPEAPAGGGARRAAAPACAATRTGLLRSSAISSRMRSNTRRREAWWSWRRYDTTARCGSASRTRASAFRRTSRSGSSPSSSAATPARPASPAPGSASRSRARSSRLTEGESVLTATRARDRRFGSSYPRPAGREALPL